VKVRLIIVENLTLTVHTHECLSLVIDLETLALEAQALSHHEAIPLVGLELLEVLVDVEQIGLAVPIKREGVSVVLEDGGECLNLVGQAYLHLLIIRFVLHPRLDPDDDPLELDPVNDFHMVVDGVRPDPLYRGEVRAGVHLTREEARQDGVLAHVLVVVGQLDGSRVSRDFCEFLDGTHQWDANGSLFKSGVMPVLLEVEEDLVPLLVLVTELWTGMYHLALILNKEFLVNEWDQGGGIQWQCAAVQVYFES
jgi:hypothetical protein